MVQNPVANRRPLGSGSTFANRDMGVVLAGVVVCTGFDGCIEVRVTEGVSVEVRRRLAGGEARSGLLPAGRVDVKVPASLSPSRALLVPVLPPAIPPLHASSS